MKTALLLHGTCDKEEFFDSNFSSLSNAHWFPWLQKQFLCRDFLCQTPELPVPYNPKYEDWKETFERFYDKSVKIIVGHSAGAGFILKWLQSNPQTEFDKLVLVAPWMDVEKEFADFLDFQMQDTLLDNVKETLLFYSMDDEVSVLDSAKVILSHCGGIKVYRFENKGHFVTSTIGTTFSELRDAIFV